MRRWWRRGRAKSADGVNVVPLAQTNNGEGARFMSTIPAPNHVLPVASSLTASPVAVHEAPTLMTLNAEVLRCDPDIQPRLALSDAHIREYAALLQEGHQLGTIVVFQDGSDSYLADGFHRVAAAKSIDLDDFPAEIQLVT